MSGKALLGKAEITPLANLAEWKRVSDKVVALLRYARGFGSFYTRIAKTKILHGADLSHGDVDFIADQAYMEEHEITDERIAKALGSKAWVNNGDVSSFEFEGHQIDFIRAPAGTVPLNVNLRGHGGGGYLLGYVGRPYGLSLSPHGLHYRLKNEEERVDDILVTADSHHVLHLLDADQYLGGSFTYGFSGIEPVYRVITTSRLFTLSAFYLNENLDYVGRPDKLEYPPFAGFIRYLQSQGQQLKAQGALWPVEPTQEQRKLLEKQLKSYKDFIEECKSAHEAFLRDKLVRARFSGLTVIEATGMAEGPELGKFMEAYKKSFGSSGKFEFFILSSGLDTIREHVKAFHETWVNGSGTELVVEELLAPIESKEGTTNIVADPVFVTPQVYVSVDDLV